MFSKLIQGKKNHNRSESNVLILYWPHDIFIEYFHCYHSEFVQSHKKILTLFEICEV